MGLFNHTTGEEGSENDLLFSESFFYFYFYFYHFLLIIIITYRPLSLPPPFLSTLRVFFLSLTHVPIKSYRKYPIALE